MKRMIAQYDYVAFFPKFMTRNDYYLQHGLIKAIPIKGQTAGFEVGYIESKKYKTTPQDKRIIQILKEIPGIKKDPEIE